MARSRTVGMTVVAAVAIATSTMRESRAQAPVIEQSGLLPSGVIGCTGRDAIVAGAHARRRGEPGDAAGQGRDALRRAPRAVGAPGAVVDHDAGRDLPGAAAEARHRGSPAVAEARAALLRDARGGRGAGGSGPARWADPRPGDRDLRAPEPQPAAPWPSSCRRRRPTCSRRASGANPILYADSQLVPYGSFNKERPGGPTQYDLNISHPIDYSRKRQARTIYAELSLRVMEQQYQDAVRRGIGDLYLAYVDVLAARRTVRYARVNAQGTDEFLRNTEVLYRQEYAGPRRRRAGEGRERHRRGQPAGRRGDASQGEAEPGRHAQLAAGLRRPSRTARLAGGARAASAGRGRVDPRRAAMPPRRLVIPAGRGGGAGGLPGSPGPTASPTPTCSISRSPSRTTPRSAPRARHPGRWGSPSRCQSTTATRGTSSGPGSTSGSRRSS